jgi:hypothetical protein
MFHLRQTSRRLMMLASAIAVLGLLLVPGAGPSHSRLKTPGTVAHAAVTKSYDQFIIEAYLGAYGRPPDCQSELLPEYNRMVNAAASNALLAECQRFVATLFETQASFDVQDLTTYQQTVEYEARNSQSFTDIDHQRAFVTDLYEAFLQRAPDNEGREFWTNDVMVEGRKKGIIAFEVCGEFSDLVASLYDGGAPDCGPPPGDGDPCIPGTLFYKKFC